MKTHAHDFFVGEQVRLLGLYATPYATGEITHLPHNSEENPGMPGFFIVREPNGGLGCYYSHEIAHLDGGDVGREMSKP